LAPLRDNKFNRLKSELKVTEAAWMNKAIIASNVCMYADCITDGWDGVLVDEKQPKKWYKSMKAMINDPQMIREMADRLTAKMQAKFDIDEITRRRFNLYKNVARDISIKELHAIPQGKSEQHDRGDVDGACKQRDSLPIEADQPCDA
jgi:glycosyltransferase involved in cell wall biosynthesis